MMVKGFILSKVPLNKYFLKNLLNVTESYKFSHLYFQVNLVALKNFIGVKWKEIILPRWDPTS